MIVETYRTLDELPVRTDTQIRHLAAPPALQQRLSELGLTPGTPIRVVRAALFGGPVQVTVRDYQLTLRRSQARCIVVD